MLHAKFITSKKLLIAKSLNRLIHSAVFKHLPSSEHDGYRAKSGKIFKAFTFKAYYQSDTIHFYFSSINKTYEEQLALAILQNRFQIGAVEIFKKEISIENEKITQDSIALEAEIAIKIKDINGKAFFLHPKDSRFYEILKNNIKERFETLLQKEFNHELDIKLIKTFKPKRFYYDRLNFTITNAIFEFKSNPEVLEFILNAGVGANSAKGVGMMRVVDLTKI